MLRKGCTECTSRAAEWNLNTLIFYLLYIKSNLRLHELCLEVPNVSVYEYGQCIPPYLMVILLMSRI